MVLPPGGRGPWSVIGEHAALPDGGLGGFGWGGISRSVGRAAEWLWWREHGMLQERVSACVCCGGLGATVVGRPGEGHVILGGGGV